MPKTKVSLEDLLQQKKKLADDIRAYCRNQKALWRMVPYLALNADGRSGYSDSFALAYTEGFWEIRIPYIGVSCYRVLVDLRSGEIINAYHNHLHPQPLASDDDVICLINNLSEINADTITKYLKDKIKQDHFYIYNPETQRKWRLEKLPQVIKLTHTEPSYIKYEDWREQEKKEREKLSTKPQ